MIKSFSNKDIEKWAEFSGDRNKVHFDKNIAAKNGLKDIIVQGMLVMLDAKLMISPYVNIPSCLNFSIKRPIFIDNDIAFDIKEMSDKVSLTVSELNQNKPSIIASLIPQDEPILTSSKEKIRVDPSILNEKLFVFSKLYPAIMMPNWLVIDSLLFGICFYHEKDNYFPQKAQRLSTEYDQDEIVTFHVDQKIYISEKVIGNSYIDFSNLSFYFEEKEILNTGSTIYTAFEFQLFDNDTVIYQSSHGCMTKAYIP